MCKYELTQLYSHYSHNEQQNPTVFNNTIPNSVIYYLNVLSTTIINYALKYLIIPVVIRTHKIIISYSQ